MDKLLEFDPSKRLTAEQVLAHPYLQRFSDPTDEPTCAVQVVVDWKGIASLICKSSNLSMLCTLSSHDTMIICDKK